MSILHICIAPNMAGLELQLALLGLGLGPGFSVRVSEPCRSVTVTRTVGQLSCKQCNYSDLQNVRKASFLTI